MCFDVNLEDGLTGETCSPGVISSGGLGPCIAIGIYDTRRKYGYMIHEANMAFNSELSAFLTNVLSKSNKEDLSVYIAGGEINNVASKNDNKHVRECRNHVKTELLKLFDKKQIKINWNNSSDAIELILETENGKFFIEHTEMDYDS
jgi:hypothetical protein